MKKQLLMNALEKKNFDTQPEKDTMVILKGDPVKGTQDQRRCKTCNATRSRLNDLCSLQGGITKDHLKELSPEDRAEFMENHKIYVGRLLQRL